jgi:hypothetical protein
VKWTTKRTAHSADPRRARSQIDRGADTLQIARLCPKRSPAADHFAGWSGPIGEADVDESLRNLSAAAFVFYERVGDERVHRPGSAHGNLIKAKSKPSNK